MTLAALVVLGIFLGAVCWPDAPTEDDRLLDAALDRLDRLDREDAP